MVELNKSAFKSFEIMKEGKVVRIDVDMDICFSVASGVVKKGILVDIKGKKEKTELEIQTKGDDGELHKETWSLAVMDENSLNIDEDEEA